MVGSGSSDVHLRAHRRPATSRGDPGGVRIALVTETFFPAVDGTTTTVKAVVDRLVDPGHQVQVIAPGPGLTTDRGCRMARVRPLDKPGSQVREALAASRPDLVHVTSPGRVGRKALEHAGRLGVPTLVVEQSPTLADVMADRVLVTSTWMLSRGAAVCGARRRHRRLPPALRDQWLHERWSRPGPSPPGWWWGTSGASQASRRTPRSRR